MEIGVFAETNIAGGQFMKEKLIVKAGLVFACAAALLLVNYFLFQLYVSEKLGLQETYIAAHDILPRQKIEESDLIAVRISSRYLADHAYCTKEEIIGKYTDIQGKIPAGSPFYRSMLYSEKDLPDRAAAQLKENQVSFSMEVDVAALGGVIAGQRVDVFVTVGARSENPVTGCLLRNVRVIDVKDHKGISLDRSESSGVPYLAELAVAGSHIDLLTMAKTYGTLQLYMSSEAYNSEAEAVLDTESPITEFLAGKIAQQVSGQ